MELGLERFLGVSRREDLVVVRGFFTASHSLETFGFDRDFSPVCADVDVDVFVHDLKRRRVHEPGRAFRRPGDR